MQIFELAPGGGGRVVWIILAILLAAGSITLVLLGARRPHFELTAEGLSIRGSLYGRTIPGAQLALGQARVVDLTKEEGLRPKWRTNGVGLPGYAAGWFRLRDGEKALVFLTNRSRALYIPTNAGYALLISPDDPDALLAAMRSRLTGA